MPVGRGLIQVTPPPVPEGAGPARRVIAPPGVYRPQWWAPDGTLLDLNPPGADWWSLKGNAGLGAPPLDLITTDNPGGGVIVEASRPRERTILWPIRMRSDTHLGLLEVWRTVTHLITQTADLGRPGELRIRRPDGSERRIEAWYQSGLEGDPEDGAWLQVTAVINFLCPDPYWRDTRQMIAEFRDEAADLDYLAPYPSVSSGRVIGAAKLTNVGQRATWPTWTIRGPMTALTATNLTRGQSFTLTHTLTAGQTVTISSRPIKVRGPGDTNLINALGLVSGGGKPWRLDPLTTSDVMLSVAGSQPDSTPDADDGTRLWLTAPIEYKTA